MEGNWDGGIFESHDLFPLTFPLQDVIHEYFLFRVEAQCRSLFPILSHRFSFQAWPGMTVIPKVRTESSKKTSKKGSL